MSALLTRALTPEAQLASEFLARLENPRLPWADRFTTWAAERGLSEAQARSVKTTVLRIRVFNSVARSRRRR